MEITLRFEMLDDSPPPPDPPDPTALGPIFIICQHYQAQGAGNSRFVTWVRDEVGRADLSGVDISVLVYRYGGTAVVATLDASTPGDGCVDWSLPPHTAASRVPQGLYRIAIKAGDAVAHAGTLEVV